MRRPFEKEHKVGASCGRRARGGVMKKKGKGGIRERGKERARERNKEKMEGKGEGEKEVKKMEG